MSVARSWKRAYMLTLPAFSLPRNVCVHVDAMRRGRIDHHRRRAKEHAVHDPEHRAVGADAEGDREDDGGGEARLGPEPADGVTEVLEDGVEHDRETPVRL